MEAEFLKVGRIVSRTAYKSLPEAKAAPYRPNFSYILQTLRTSIFCWLIQRVSADQLLVLIELYANTLERKRPDRSGSKPLHRLNPKPRRQYK